MSSVCLLHTCEPPLSTPFCAQLHLIGSLATFNPQTRSQAVLAASLFCLGSAPLLCLPANSIGYCSLNYTLCGLHACLTTKSSKSYGLWTTVSDIMRKMGWYPVTGFKLWLQYKLGLYYTSSRDRNWYMDKSLVELQCCAGSWSLVDLSSIS